MKRISLLGTRDLHTDEEIKPQRDYGIFLVASRISEEKTDDENEIKYKLKISHIQELIDLQENREVKFEKGKSPSQKLRFLIESNLGDEEYENFIKYIMGRIDELCDNYRENNK